MHRFRCAALTPTLQLYTVAYELRLHRKKSDAKQQQQASPRGASFAGSVHSNSSVLDIAATPTQSPVQSSQPGAQIGLPLLPQVNDFRSSLIIPTYALQLPLILFE